MQVGGGTELGDSGDSRISYATFDGGGIGGYPLVYIYRTGAVLDHVTVRNSGTGGLRGLNPPSGASLSITHSRFEDNATFGLQAEQGLYLMSDLILANNGGDGLSFSLASDSQLQNGIIQGNGGVGIHAAGSDRLDLAGLTISGNGSYGIGMETQGLGSALRNSRVQNNGVAAKLHPDIVLDNVTWIGNTRSEIEWISGEIWGNRTWARLPEISTYRVLGAITARDGTVLTIEPGVSVTVAANVSLTAQGVLSAQGTEEAPISFRRQTAGSAWGHVQVGGGSVLGDSGGSRISHVTFDGGGIGGYTLYFYRMDAAADHVTIRNGTGMGIYYYPDTRSRIVVESVTIENNTGIAIKQYAPGASVAYHDLTLSGNGTDAVVIAGGAIYSDAEWDLAEAGVPVRSGALSIAGKTLAFTPGSRLEFDPGASLSVGTDATLLALGYPSMPITLTGVTEQPGAWRGVWVQQRSLAILDNCDLGYGGASGDALLKVDTEDAVVANCRIHDSAGDGVRVQWGAFPVFLNNAISDNAFGARNVPAPAPDADLRRTWWGAASGPHHATLNPTGEGNPVGDDILFDPWLTEPPTPATSPGGLSVLLSGPRIASPGSRVSYNILFANRTQQAVSDAVLVAQLPRDGDFAGGSPGATAWGKRKQVFWRSVDLAPGGARAFYVTVGYHWNIPSLTWESTLGGITGTPGASSVFDVADYLNYATAQLTGTQVLTAAELDGELAASPGLNQLYQSALAQGYLHGAGFRLSYAANPPLIRIILFDFSNRKVIILQQQGTRLLATVAEPQAVVMSDPEGGDRYDFITRQHGLFGGWASPEGRLNAAAPAGSPNFVDCFKNCIASEVPEWILSRVSAGASTALTAKDCLNAQASLEEEDVASCAASVQDAIPFLGEILGGAKCVKDCKNDPTSNYCVGDKITCGCTGGSILGYCHGQEYAETWICDKETGVMGWTPGPSSSCATYNVTSPEKCVEGVGCVSCRALKKAPAGPALEAVTPVACSADGGMCAVQPTQIVVAKDPNAKYGPVGDLVPGQQVTYTITYENEGAGNAYGVFVIDELSEDFDLATLSVASDASFIERTHQIIWYVGELAAKGQPGSSGVVTFTVRLRDDLPSGTVVYNQATVHFPSVPEVTPTNPVVNVVAPLAAVPQQVEVDAGSSLNIHLTGREASDTPLNFAIARRPLYGDLSGNAPDITYTPMSGFVGQDSFGFTASNVITVSQPADVQIVVNPSPDDLQPPTVTWVKPANGSQEVAISASPLFTDTLGPVYGPLLLAEFSESMDASTVTTDTIRLGDQAGYDIGIEVLYDPVVRRAAIMPIERLAEGENYTATIGSGVADSAGNPMAADYAWSFKTGYAGLRRIYLPLVLR